MDSPQDIEATLLALVRRRSVPILPDERLSKAHLEQDLGLDSMKVIELLEEIEERFDFSVPDDDLAHINTVNDLRTAIEKNAGSGIFRTI